MDRGSYMFREREIERENDELFGDSRDALNPMPATLRHALADIT